MELYILGVSKNFTTHIFPDTEALNHALPSDLAFAIAVKSFKSRNCVHLLALCYRYDRVTGEYLEEGNLPKLN